MEVAVTGASGFIGRQVVETLLARGYSVRGVTRGTRQPARPSGAVRYVRADVTVPLSLSGVFDGADAVIHLVGIIAERRGATFERVHHEGTVNVLDAARSAGVGRFVQMSALGARPDGPSRYQRTKWMGEEAVRESGRAWTIFRPSVIFGPGDEFVNRFARMARFTPLMPLVRRGARLQPVWVEDVAHCLCEAVASGMSAGKTYSLGGPRIYTLEELIRMVVRLRTRFGRLFAAGSAADRAGRRGCHGASHEQPAAHAGADSDARRG